MSVPQAGANSRKQRISLFDAMMSDMAIYQHRRIGAIRHFLTCSAMR